LSFFGMASFFCLAKGDVTKKNAPFFHLRKGGIWDD